jgi:hypothetical protein
MNRLYLISLTIFAFIIIQGCKKDKNDDSNSSSTVLNVNMYPVHPVRGNKITLTIHMTNTSGLTQLKLKVFARDSVSLTPTIITIDKPMLSFPTDTTYFYRYVVPQGTIIGDTIKFISLVSARNSSNVADTHKVIINSAYGPIRKWTTPITLYGQILLANHYFSSLNGNIFDESNVGANVSVVDIFYASLGTQLDISSFISPASRNYFGFLPPITGMTKTVFGTSSVTTSVFDVLVNDSLIGAVPSTLSDSTIAISQNNVYEFINSNMKKGFIKVSSISPGQSGNVVFEVKVQE